MKRVLLIGVALVAMGAKAPKGALPAAQPMTASDKATGAKAHPEIMAEFGGAYDAPQAAYVRTVGQKIAMQSGLSNAQNDFTVTLLNSSVNNAFAIPGGYVYVTRQLLGLMNNEAELASVMGHEVGHVAARHGQKRNKRATLGGLGAAAATILGGVLAGQQGAQLGQQLGGTVAQRWVLGYSRAQEYEADDLGVSYLAKGGYDPNAASTMLAALAAQTALDARVQGRGDNKLPAWASTHPDPASRVVRAAQKAAASQPVGKALNADTFINQLDNLMYDDDPKQGVVEGQDFIHPDMRLKFTAPAGFAVSNGTDAVTISGTTGQASFSAGPYSGDMDAYIAAVYKALAGDNATINYGSVAKSTINGIPVGRATTTANSQSGQVNVTVTVYEFAKDKAYHILAISPVGSGDVFSSLFGSVRRISDAEAAAVRPRKLDIVAVKKGDTISSLSARMAYTSFQTERFLTLNALKAGDALPVGRKVKLVVYGN
jgi:predicted Zn-dependent protease